MTTHSHNQRLSSFWNSPEAIFFSVRLSAACIAHMADAEVAPQMTSIYDLDLWNNELVVTGHETINIP